MAITALSPNMAIRAAASPAQRSRIRQMDRNGLKGHVEGGTAREGLRAQLHLHRHGPWGMDLNGLLGLNMAIIGQPEIVAISGRIWVMHRIVQQGWEG